MDKVIVIGCAIPGYAVIRALANKNIHIIAVTYNERDIAHLSKHVSEVVRVPRPDKDEQQFIGSLLKHAPQWEGALILESSDNSAIPLSKNKELLSKYYRLVTPAWDQLSTFVEKAKTYALAKECDVPIPATVVLSRIEDLKGISQIEFPAILKPVNSFNFQYRFVVKNFIVKNDEELNEKLKLCVDAGQPMLLQEIIPGPDENLFKLMGYINSQGQMVGKFFHRKLRQHPAHFGVMRVGVSTEPFPEVEEFTQRLLQQANYRGYFSIEFKKDPRSGQLKLMENNCRLVRCSLLATASGVNYPWIIYQDLIKNQQTDVRSYRTGTYWIEVSRDFPDSLFRHKEEHIGLRDYFRPYLAKNKVFGDLDFHDMKPFFRVAREKIGDAIQKFLTRFRLSPSTRS